MEVLQNLLLFLISVSALYFFISIVMYRLPSSQETSVFDSEIVFKVIDIEFSNREIFETTLLGHSVISLVEGEQRFYIKHEDKAILWAINPREMSALGYTLKVKLKAQPLFFGGYGIAAIETVTKISKQPIIRK